MGKTPNTAKYHYNIKKSKNIEKFLRFFRIFRPLTVLFADTGKFRLIPGKKRTFTFDIEGPVLNIEFNLNFLLRLHLEVF